MPAQGKTMQIYKPIDYIKRLSERLEHSGIYGKAKYTLSIKPINMTSKFFTNAIS